MNLTWSKPGQKQDILSFVGRMRDSMKKKKFCFVEKGTGWFPKAGYAF